jgi:hypothetical protein
VGADGRLTQVQDLGSAGDRENHRDALARAPDDVVASPTEWRATRVQHPGAVTPLAAGHALLEHARRLAPDFPGADSRAADLEHHVHVKNLIDRVSRALGGR